MTAELLDLAARWVHVIAGIMWVGNSLLFNWLDRNLVVHPDQTPPALRSGGASSIWLLHSGGFYFVEKTLLPGQKLPVPLHWFKWQAYTTWLTGVALLVIVYWAGGRAALADSASDPRTALAVAIGGLAAGWLIYEMMNRFVAPRLPALALASWIVALLVISRVFMSYLDPRAAYLHFGALLATIMAGNVFFTIVPSQRQLVAAIEAGDASAAAKDSARAKRVSIHNNYFTFPVIALMVSNHFSGLYGARDAWSILIVIMAGGAAVRHVLNMRYTFAHWQPALAVTMVATVWLIHVFQHQTRSSPVIGKGDGPAADTTSATFTNVRHVIDRRCGACHSVVPTDPSILAAPAGVMFDTPEQIVAHATRINERAVVTRTMPLGNKTRMNDDERALIGRWFARGAPGR